MSGDNQAILPVKTVYALLADPRRRFLLYRLLETETEQLDDLSRRIVARERDGPLPAGDDDAREKVTISFVHNHLPRLADHGIIEYDLRSGDIVPVEGFDELRSVLQKLERIEAEASLPRPS